MLKIATFAKPETVIGYVNKDDTANMGHIREYYERIIKLKESEWEFIASHFDRKVFAKKQIIT